MSTTAPQNLESRLPDPSRFFPELVGMIATMVKVTRNGSVPQSTLDLMALRAGQLVGSTYHTIGRTEQLRTSGETEERITAVASWHDAPYFTEAERIALELVDAILIPNPFGERVSDDFFARATAHYDDKALWTLALAVSVFCYFVPVALVGKPIPGMPLGENYTR